MSAPPQGLVRLMHLDLDQPIPALTGGSGTFVVVWFRGVPLGKLDLDSSQLPRTASQVAELIAPAITAAVHGHLFAPEAEPNVAPVLHDLNALRTVGDPLARLADRLTLPDGSGDAVSVVVCAQDRAESLGRCLAGLAAQRHQPLEVIVVGGTPASDGMMATHPKVRHVLERRPGWNSARNAGARASRGTVVAFIDDDAQPHPDWVGRVGAAFTDPSIAALTGQVLPAALDTEEQVLFERWWTLGRDCTPRVYGPSFFASTRHRGAPVWEVGPAVNMAFRRDVLAGVGPFDQRFDYDATGRAGAGEMWYRLVAAGHRIRYEPAAVVHREHGGGRAELRKQIREFRSGHAAGLLMQWEKSGHSGNLLRLAVGVPAHSLGLAAQRAIGVRTPQSSMLRDEVAGAVHGTLHYLQSRLSGARCG